MDINLHDLYETIYYDLVSYLKENSIYDLTCTKYKPNEISVFPLVTCVEGTSEYEYTTLKYTDELYRYDIMEINIFAQNKPVDDQMVSGMTIKDEILSHICNYFKNVYKFNLKVTPNAPNVDDTIYRGVVNVSCKVDTKFKDKLVLYPK